LAERVDVAPCRSIAIGITAYVPLNSASRAPLNLNPAVGRLPVWAESAEQ
jgi:hypothetical protein